MLRAFIRLGSLVKSGARLRQRSFSGGNVGAHREIMYVAKIIADMGVNLDLTQELQQTRSFYAIFKDLN